ncbi:hypothetical protein SUGI_0925480 [Cryptomeria japonica]|nr:hypothetical protein SUGI_0925480 [Cryptomeria japonica]
MALFGNLWQTISHKCLMHFTITKYKKPKVEVVRPDPRAHSAILVRAADDVDAKVQGNNNGGNANIEVEEMGENIPNN